jgi:predicted transcriptional regulator
VDTVKSLRLSDDLVRSVRYLARGERLDESTAIRQLVALGTAAYAVRLYRQGKITLNEAAEIASTTPREMIDVLLDHGVKGNVTVNQARRALDYVLEANVSA